MQLIIYRENFFTLKERGRENEGGMDREEGTREESNCFFFYTAPQMVPHCVKMPSWHIIQSTAKIKEPMN